MGTACSSVTPSLFLVGDVQLQGTTHHNQRNPRTYRLCSCTTIHADTHLAVNRDIAFISRTHSPSSSLVLAAIHAAKHHSRKCTCTHVSEDPACPTHRELYSLTHRRHQHLSEYFFQACHRTMQHKIAAMHHHRPRIQPSIQPSHSIVRHSPRSSLLDLVHIPAHQHATLQLLLLMNRQRRLFNPRSSDHADHGHSALSFRKLYSYSFT